MLRIFEEETRDGRRDVVRALPEVGADR